MSKSKAQKRIVAERKKVMKTMKKKPSTRREREIYKQTFASLLNPPI